MDPGKPLRAASYCRLSLARMGDTTKVDDQDRINHELAARRGWTISPEHVYKDNSRSAWRRDRKRPGWDAMIAAVERGELDAIIVYHGDRFVRQPRDLLDLIDMATGKGIRLASPTGDYNLDDPDHQMMLTWMAARAKNEVDHMSRRMRDGHERRRRQGIVRKGGRGGRPYGFEPDGVTHRPEEVALLREATDRIMAGEGTGEIARDWNARGHRSVTGAKWTHGTLKKMLQRPRVAGLMPDGKSPAAWAPVLDDDPVKARQRWEAVCAVLDGRAAAYAGFVTNTRTHLLSSIPVCGPCGNPMVIRHNTRGRQLIGYGCNTPGCRRTHRAAEYLEGYVIGHVLELLNDRDFLAELAAPADEGAAAEIAELEARKAAAEQTLAALVDNPHIDPALLAASITGFAERIADKRREIATSSRARLLLEHAGLDEAAWEALPLGTRRALITATYRITVWPVRKKGPGFEADTIDMDPVTD